MARVLIEIRQMHDEAVKTSARFGWQLISRAFPYLAQHCALAAAFGSFVAMRQSNAPSKSVRNLYRRSRHCARFSSFGLRRLDLSPATYSNFGK